MFGVIVLKQVPPFKPGSYRQLLGWRSPGFQRYVVFGWIEGREQSRQVQWLTLGGLHLGMGSWHSTAT